MLRNKNSCVHDCEVSINKNMVVSLIPGNSRFLYIYMSTSHRINLDYKPGGYYNWELPEALNLYSVDAIYGREYRKKDI